MAAMGTHPLDRAVWSSLTGRQAPLALGRDGARRLAPEYGLFAALDDETPQTLTALAALVAEHGPVAVVELEPPPPIAGTCIAQAGALVQMICDALVPGPEPDFPIQPLGDADAAEMLALATLTRPGPFFARTH